MDPRFAKLPRSLQVASRNVVLGENVPALVAHPQWGDESPVAVAPAPAVVWLHGRSVNKELDPGRYLRWIRGGIGAIALDLPGHGERFDSTFQGPERTLELIARGRAEINAVLESVRELGAFDMSRLLIGGMSAGGMVALSRLCSPHPFIGACLEGTTGNLHDLYHPQERTSGRDWPVDHAPEDIARVDPIEHLEGFMPIPLLALHNRGDQMVPIEGQLRFLDQLRAQYVRKGADPGMIELKIFEDSGAPQEHAGFGRHANEAKNIQLGFIRRVVGLD